MTRPSRWREGQRVRFLQVGRPITPGRTLHKLSATCVCKLSEVSFFSSLLSQQRLAGGALVLAVTQFGASLAGLVRDRVLAQTFPPGIDPLDVASVYIAAFRPSDFLFQVLVMSALSVAMVPLLAAHFAHGRREEMHRLTSSILLIGNVAFGCVAVVLALLLPTIAPSLVQFTGPSLDLYVRFAQLTCLTNFLFVTGNALGFVLVTRQVYWVYGMTPILYTLGTIVGTILLTPSLGPLGPMVGTVGGAVVYVVIRLVGVLRSGFRFNLGGRLFHPDLLEMGWLMLPRMFALGAGQLELLLFDSFASGLPLGSVTVNAYARNFQSVAVGVVGIALAQSAFSPLSQALALKEVRRFWSTFRKGILLCLLLTTLAAAVLVFLGRVAASLVHLTDPAVVASFLGVLTLYALSIPFESGNHLLLRAYYAAKDSLWPAMTAVGNGAVAILLLWTLTPSLGILALPLGFLFGQGVQSLLLSLRLRARIGRVVAV